MAPRYPEIRIELHSRNPFVWVSAVRQALRRQHVAADEITRFTEEALRQPEPDRMRDVCASWASIEAGA